MTREEKIKAIMGLDVPGSGPLELVRREAEAILDAIESPARESRRGSGSVPKSPEVQADAPGREFTDEQLAQAARAIPFLTPYDQQDESMQASQRMIARAVLEAVPSLVANAWWKEEATAWKEEATAMRRRATQAEVCFKELEVELEGLIRLEEAARVVVASWDAGFGGTPVDWPPRIVLERTLEDCNE